MIPVYKSKAEVFANIKSNAPTEISQPGKIFMFGNYIFLNDIDKGIHIIDNSNPANPQKKAFINIPGNLDIAVKGNTLYADLYSDMVVIDITDPMQARFVKYIAGIFPQRNYVNGFMSDSNRVVVDWIKRDTTVRIDQTCNNCFYAQLSSSGGGGPMMGPSSPVAMAGSMARFALVNDYLYTVNSSKLSSFNISNPLSPLQTASQQVAWNIETIYPFRNKLFIGSMTGMFIYDLANPAVPKSEGQFTHMRSCDPVIADGNYAYVTLRGGNFCGDINNQMDIVNVSSMSSPWLVKSVMLKNPYGLSKDGNSLFVCDGTSGLKMFDATDPANPILKKEIGGIETYDAIAYNGRLLLVAKDGLYQYTYSFPSTLNLESKLVINRK